MDSFSTVQDYKDVRLKQLAWSAFSVERRVNTKCGWILAENKTENNGVDVG